MRGSFTFRIVRGYPPHFYLYWCRGISNLILSPSLYAVIFAYLLPSIPFQGLLARCSVFINVALFARMILVVTYERGSLVSTTLLSRI